MFRESEGMHKNTKTNRRTTSNGVVHNRNRPNPVDICILLRWYHFPYLKILKLFIQLLKQRWCLIDFHSNSRRWIIYFDNVFDANINIRIASLSFHKELVIKLYTLTRSTVVIIRMSKLQSFFSHLTIVCDFYVRMSDVIGCILVNNRRFYKRWCLMQNSQWVFQWRLHFETYVEYDLRAPLQHIVLYYTLLVSRRRHLHSKIYALTSGKGKTSKMKTSIGLVFL